MKKLFLTLILILFPMCVFGADVKVKEEYMESTGEYRYYLNDEIYIQSSQKLGSVVTNVVKITYNDYVNVLLYKNNNAVEFHSGDYLYDDGEYTVVIKNGDDIGRVKFILNTISYGTIDMEDSFYNHTTFTQSYDSERKMFKESIGSYYSIYSTVPNCAVTEKAVKINYNETDANAYITVTKDGEEIDYTNGRMITDEGCYSISLVYDINGVYEEDLDDVSGIESIDDIDLGEMNDDDGEYYSNLSYAAETAVLSFRIVSSPQNLLNYINPPRDYVISSVMIDGKKTAVSDETLFKARQDGEYRIIFRNPSGILPNYAFTYERLTQMPTVTFEGVGKGGIAKQPVAYTPDQDYTQVQISKNGGVIETEEGVINADGLYKITVSDDAGNVNDYMINVDIPIKISIWWVIAAAAVMAAGIYFYIRYVKNNIQIR